MRDTVLRFGEAVRKLGCHRCGDVLNQRPARRDVQDLRAAADCEDRYIVLHGASREVELELVASRLGVFDSLVAILSVKRRINIAAASQQYAIDRLEHRARALAHLEHARPRA